MKEVLYLMTKLEILQHIVNSHNRLAGVMVSGDNVILMGETLKELRFLAIEVQKDVEQEEAPADLQDTDSE